MNPKQIKMARKLAGTMYGRKLAKHIGVSWSNLMRWARDNKVSLNAHKYKIDLIREVCAFYSEHGRNKTAKKFKLRPKQVEAIIYRYRLHQQRQVKWKNEEIIELVKMAGLVSPHAQAKFFKRPNANAGSIRSAWTKKFKMGQGCINGIVHWNSKVLANEGVRYLKPVAETRSGDRTTFRRLVLWVDLEKNLKKETPEFLKEAISTMANFQRWIWQDQNPKPKILKMIKEREEIP